MELLARGSVITICLRVCGRTNRYLVDRLRISVMNICLLCVVLVARGSVMNNWSLVGKKDN